MAFDYSFYLMLLGFFVGAGGVGIGYGQFKLGCKEIFDASGS